MPNLDHLRVVLVNPRNPLNIGAVARAMRNFGFSCLRVVNPYDPAFREARSAVGAADLLQSAEQYESVAEAIADCSLVVGTTAARDRELRQPLKPLPEAAHEIRRHLAQGSVAILFGSEKRGLSNHDLSHCHWHLRIPTREDHPSMNLGQAVAVTLYEIARDANPPPAQPEATSLATAETLERLSATLLESLSVAGYMTAAAQASAVTKVRRLVRRLALSSEDAEALMGMLRQILWKLQPPAARK